MPVPVTARYLPPPERLARLNACAIVSRPIEDGRARLTR